MGIRNFPVVSIGTVTGSRTDNVAAAPGVVSIPVMQNGDAPKFLMCKVTGGSTPGFISICPTTGANGALATGLPMVTGQPHIIFNVHGFTSIGTEGSAADMELHLYPLEDF